MASNVLTGRIQITAPGVTNVFNQVAVSATKAEAGLKRIVPASNSANLALINTGRVVQDLPFGFLGIANNLNPLLESFQRLKAETGSTGAALQGLKKSLLGAGGLGFALSLVSSAMIVFGDKLFGAGQSMTRLGSVLAGAKDQFTEAFTVVTSLTNQIQLAKEGFISKEGVVKQYNETIGKTTGIVKSLEEAEAELIKNGDAYVDLMLKKAIANIALGKAAEAAFKIEQNWQRIIESPVGGREILGVSLYDVAIGKISNQNKKLQKQVDDFKKIGQNAQAAAAEIVKAFGFDFFGTNKGGAGIKVKPDKVDVDLSGADITVPGTNQIFIRKKLIDALGLTQIKIPKIFLGGKGPVEKDDGFGLIAEQIRKQEQELRGLADTISGVLTPAFQGFFDTVKGGGNAFKAFANAAGQALIALIEKLAIAAVLSLVLSSITGAGAAIGAASGKFSDIFKFLTGFGGARASGGPVQGGKSYLVGEQGPEIFRPNTGGRIVPNNQLSYGAGVAGGLQISGVVTNILRGKDLVQLITLQQQSNNRLI